MVRLRTLLAARPPRPVRLRLEPLDERALPSGFRQTNLVADEPGVAQITDPQLVNAWGIAFNPTGAVWVSAHGTGLSTLYNGDVNGSPVTKNPLVVAIPDGAPTGQLFNAQNTFPITNGTVTAPRSIFVFAGETGSITGWNPAVPPATQARVGVDTNGEARYTGIAAANTAANNRLYAADLANGEIDVFDASFAPLDLGPNAFVDPRLPRGFAPFNIQNLNGTLYVTYARADKGGDIDDLKGGAVSAFDLNGNLLRRIATQGQLDAPWGLAIAPAGFGNFGGALLVGNHGNGRINAYDSMTGTFLGKLREEGRGRPVRIDGLFGLGFGNGAPRGMGDTNALYFAAGPNGGADGLFGSLRFVPDAPAASAALSLASAPVSGDALGRQVGGTPGTTLTAPDRTTEPPADEVAIFLGTPVVPPPAESADPAPLFTGTDEPAGPALELQV